MPPKLAPLMCGLAETRLALQEARRAMIPFDTAWEAALGDRRHLLPS